ncbi:DMT family transporter [Photobacterium galatheae]|uniref:Membrane protein n=1 Tax=Photobacterium galatheae TaxID=1654360 RepID=A0A066RS90_9GAMM|nr:DMT family transporter [Photobacterium galatheae]KDM93315.1 membrane protein [Photobacterium galatheae]MCM0150438.1 DMT family transporter [Photobacterium galatheae]
MFTFLLIAMFNGIMIGTARTINGQLSVSLGSFSASLWNHVVGLLFLTLILVTSLGSDWQFSQLSQLPSWAYIGGVFGALFVAISSYIFPRLGAMNAAIFVIAGQMLSAVIIDCLSQGTAPGVYRVLGVCLVLSGIYLSSKKK